MQGRKCNCSMQNASAPAAALCTQRRFHPTMPCSTLSLPQLLADCYYVNGKRNRTYREVVNAVFGRKGDIILGW